MMQRSIRLSAIAATSLIMLVGGTAARAADTGSLCPAESAKGSHKSAKAEKAKESRAAKKMVSRMERDLNHLVKRLDRDMRKSLAPHFEAIRDLADSDANDDDLKVLVDQFDAALMAADADADQLYAKESAARRDELAAMSSSTKLLARADSIIARNQRKLDQRIDRLQRVFDNRLEEYFPDSQHSSDDHDDDCDDNPSPEPGSGS